MFKNEENWNMKKYRNFYANIKIIEKYPKIKKINKNVGNERSIK